MEAIKKILILRFSSIGDIVLTSAIVRCIKKQFPHIELHFLVKKQYALLLTSNPYIDKVHFFEKKTSEVIAELKKENFDFVVDLQKNRRSFYIKTCLGKPSGTFNKLNKKKWILVNLKINLLPQVHVVDRYFQAVRKINVLNDNLGLDFFLPEKDKLDAKKILPSDFHQGYIALVFGSKQQTKQLPIEKMIEIVNSINKPFVLLGNVEDYEKAEHLKKIYHEKVFNACGNYNINQSASLAEQAELVITTDTGLMHIAAALDKRVISIWGNTVTDFGMYPYYPKGKEKFHVVEVKNLRCRPCSKLGFKKCPRKHFRCMMDIDVTTISALVNNSKY